MTFLEQLLPWLLVGGGLLVFSGTARGVASFLFGALSFILTLIIASVMLLKPIFGRIWGKIKEISYMIDRKF